MSLKMYVLIRDDMTEGQQAVQAGHALAQFGLEHPDEFAAWQEDSNILIYLSVHDIGYWKTVLDDGEFVHSVFHEPELTITCRHWSGDFNYAQTIDADTAIAVGPNWACQYVLFKDLPLALRPKQEQKKWWRR